MYVGACRITFLLPGNSSLKGKRKVLRQICDKLRHKFHAAAAEVGDPELWSEVEIGFAMVSGNASQARAMLENILGYLEDMMIAPIGDVELEVVPFDEVSSGGSYGGVERWNDESAWAKHDLSEEGE